jgi:hypothetical protein
MAAAPTKAVAVGAIALYNQLALVDMNCSIILTDRRSGEKDIA